MDITVELLAVPKTHILNDAAKEARRYRRGDVVEVFRRSEVTEPPSPNSPFVFLHVTGIPDTRTFEQVRNKIMQPVLQPAVIVDPEIYRRRKFRVRVSTLPQVVKDAFISNKEFTATWTQVKNYIRRKNVTVFLDQSTDDESTFINDTDLD